MPKSTFNNLSQEKQANVEAILLDTFYDRHISQVKVSEIVEKMGMARGSFYKYFEDLEDAHTFLIRKSSGIVHQDIMKDIYRNQDDFFKGVEEYLQMAARLDHQSNTWKRIQLLTQSSDVFARRREDVNETSPMYTGWQELLDKNGLKLKNFHESLAFLYFLMDIVMDSLTAFVVNGWDEADLIADYRYKVKWLEHGVR